jgi:predicted glycoside hydrolase/deacetylase ChbG (UPF0249 family)
MTYNPVLKKLGFSEKDRVVVIHADDVAVSQASIDAYLELMDFGTISCGSAMTPTPWFPELARIVGENPKLDMGLHLPVTCEHKAYCWRPVSNVDPDSGLVDACGYFHPSPSITGTKASVESVIQEFEAQIQLQRKLDLTPTHLDNHHALPFVFPRFIEPFLALAKRYSIPPVIMRMRTMFTSPPAPAPEQPAQKPSGPMDVGAIMAAAETVDKIADTALEEGLPVPDYISGMPTKVVDDRLALAKQIISDLKPGLTHFAFHPTRDTPEARAITPTWPYRVGDYETFMTKELKYHRQSLVSRPFLPRVHKDEVFAPYGSIRRKSQLVLLPH